MLEKLVDAINQILARILICLLVTMFIAQIIIYVKGR